MYLLIAGPLALIVLFRFIPPPVTPLMVIRHDPGPCAALAMDTL